MGGRKVFNTFRRINCRVYGALWGGTWPSSSVRLSRQSEIIAVTATMLPVVTWDIVFSLPFSIRWFLCSSPRILPLRVRLYLTTAKNVRIKEKNRFPRLSISLVKDVLWSTKLYNSTGYHFGREDLRIREGIVGFDGNGTVVRSRDRFPFKGDLKSREMYHRHRGNSRGTRPIYLLCTRNSPFRLVDARVCDINSDRRWSREPLLP